MCSAGRANQFEEENRRPGLSDDEDLDPFASRHGLSATGMPIAEGLFDLNNSKVFKFAKDD